MDVTKRSRLLSLAFVAIFLSACEQQSGGTVPYQSLGSCDGTAIQKHYIIKWKDGQLTGATFNTQNEMREVLSHFADDIELVENDQRVVQHEAQEATQTGPSSSSTALLNWGPTAVQASYAWDAGVKGAGVVVAIVDSGVDTTHPQISPRIAVNSGEIANNGVDDDGNGLIDDVNGYWFWTDVANDGTTTKHDTANVVDTTGHGTHVAGIVAADHSTGSILGMAPAAKIIPIGFMGTEVDPSTGKTVGTGSGSLYDATRGIYYAASRGARIINASWGGAGCSSALRKAISELETYGVLFVDAAGNAGANIETTPEYPAGFGVPGQIVVGSFGTAGYQSQFSNFSRNLVHLLAPGEDIISTYPGNTTKKMSGTSMASPFVAGTAALLMSDRPNATVAQIKQAILSSVVTGNFEVSTRGKLNVKNALAALHSIVPQ